MGPTRIILHFKLKGIPTRWIKYVSVYSLIIQKVKKVSIKEQLQIRQNKKIGN